MNEIRRWLGGGVGGGGGGRGGGKTICLFNKGGIVPLIMELIIQDFGVLRLWIWVCFVTDKK
jgi:hypothetical protein